MDCLLIVMASGEATELHVDLTKARVLEVKRKYDELKRVPSWQQRLMHGAEVLNDGVALSSCGISAGAELQLIIVQNLSDLPELGAGWILYMFNGKDAQHRDALKYGSNSGGLGNPGVVLCDASDQTGCYKMSEVLFDEHCFTEVAAVGSDSSWVSIRQSCSGVIPATDAFNVGSSEGYAFAFSNGFKCDSSANRTNDPEFWSEEHVAGPFFDDVSYGNSRDGSGWQWMWEDLHQRKGTVLGATSSSALYSIGGYAWAWYGRSSLVSPCRTISCIPACGETTEPKVTSGIAREEDSEDDDVDGGDIVLPHESTFVNIES